MNTTKKLISKDVKLLKVSKARPKSLVLRIPAIIRDLLELNTGDTVTLDVIEEQDCRYIKIYKKLD